MDRSWPAVVVVMASSLLVSCGTTADPTPDGFKNAFVADWGSAGASIPSGDSLSKRPAEPTALARHAFSGYAARYVIPPVLANLADEGPVRSSLERIRLSPELDAGLTAISADGPFSPGLEGRANLLGLVLQPRVSLLVEFGFKVHGFLAYDHTFGWAVLVNAHYDDKEFRETGSGVLTPEGNGWSVGVIYGGWPMWFEFAIALRRITIEGNIEIDQREERFRADGDMFQFRMGVLW